MKVTAPRARASTGLSGVIWMSLPASVTLPCTFDFSSAAIGRSSCSRTSALPLALALASAWFVIAASGELLTTPSDCAQRPAHLAA